MLKEKKMLQLKQTVSGCKTKWPTQKQEKAARKEQDTTNKHWAWLFLLIQRNCFYQSEVTALARLFLIKHLISVCCPSSDPRQLEFGR